MAKKNMDRVVTVCSECKRASCWHDIHPCERSKTAGTVDMKVKDLDKLRAEHPSHYSVGQVMKVTGGVL